MSNIADAQILTVESVTFDAPHRDKRGRVRATVGGHRVEIGPSGVAAVYKRQKGHFIRNMEWRVGFDELSVKEQTLIGAWLRFVCVWQNRSVDLCRL